MYVILSIIVFALIIGFVIFFPFRKEFKEKFLATKRKRVNFLFAVGYLAVLFAVFIFLLNYFNKPPEEVLKDPLAFLASQNEEAETKEVAEEELEIKPLEVGDEAPDFELKNIVSGKNVKLSGLENNIALLTFSTTWCKYCNKQLPILKEFDKEGRLDIYQIDIAEGEDVVSKYVELNKINFPLLLDTDSAVSKQYSVTGTPAHFFVKDGKICSKRAGYLEKDKLVEAANECKK